MPKQNPKQDKNVRSNKTARVLNLIAKPNRTDAENAADESEQEARKPRTSRKTAARTEEPSATPRHRMQDQELEAQIRSALGAAFLSPSTPATEPDAEDETASIPPSAQKIRASKNSARIAARGKTADSLMKSRLAPEPEPEPEDEEEEPAPTPSARFRTRRKAALLPVSYEDEDDYEDDEPEPTPPPRSYTKRKAVLPPVEYDEDEDDYEDDEPEPTPPPRSRTKRKAAPVPVVEEEPEEEIIEEPENPLLPPEPTAIEKVAPPAPIIQEEYHEIFDPANEEEEWQPTPTPTAQKKSLFPEPPPPEPIPKVKTKKKTVSTVKLPEFEEGSNDFPELETTPALEIPVTIEEEDYVEEPVSCMNIMQSIVEPKLDHFMRIHGVCTCQRCRVDVMALALSNLPARYVVVTDKERIPRLSLLENEYLTDAMQQIMHACQRVKAHPHHKRKP